MIAFFYEILINIKILSMKFYCFLLSIYLLFLKQPLVNKFIIGNSIVIPICLLCTQNSMIISYIIILNIFAVFLIKEKNNKT